MDSTARDRLDKEFLVVIRDWLGTPHVPQQKSRFGCDCVGVLLGAAYEMGYDFDEFDYPARPLNANSNILAEMVERSCDRIEEKIPGSILLFTVGRYVQHLAIYVENNRIIHTDRTVMKVVEIDYPASWDTRLYGIFRLKWDKAKSAP
jgi:cell wall-associated NlpC family hydrolase